MHGNIRTAYAATKSFKEALKISYRSGTVTGMLTDGLGLLGGTPIFMIFLKNAPEVLLGFGFGGTLLTLFMRVGGESILKRPMLERILLGKLRREYLRTILETLRL